jgi:hypothetical protein
MFHQGIVALLHAMGLIARGPFSTTPVPPFGFPAIVCLSFWGGVYGAAFGAVSARFRIPMLLAGLGLGLLAVLVGWFVVAPLKGQPIASGFAAWPMERSLLINLTWGLGVGVLLPLLTPRPLVRRALG